MKSITDCVPTIMKIPIKHRINASWVLFRGLASVEVAVALSTRAARIMPT
jgi:hypothetical protein